MNFWFAELRFTGWATNPNQMALLLSFVPFLALDCAKHDARLHAQFGWFLCAATIGIAGIVSASDALALAWLAGLSLCGATLWWRSVFGNQASVRSVLLLALVLPLVTLVWLIPYIAPLLPTVTDAALDVYDTGSQGATRIRVWGYGISAALDSPFIGLGPGPHSGYWGPHQGLEAHNTLIDWTSITGIFGTVAFLALIGCAFRRSISSQRLWISAGVVTITVFCMFHYTVRQPLFWTYLIIALLSNNFSISARTPTTHTVCR